MQKFYLSPFSFMLGFFFFVSFSLLGREQTGKYQTQPNTYTSRGTPSSTVFNINNISSWQYNDGRSAVTPSGTAGVIYPRSTAGVVYQDGIIWGGFVNNATQPLRVGGQTYRTGTQGGKIISIGVPEDPNAPHVRIYRIRRDYLTVSDDELRLDAAEINQIDPSQVTQAMIDAVRAQYATDWNEWPVQYGAPFYDLNGNGIYEPALGEDPGLQNADMVIWFVCNDLNEGLTHDLYGSDPIGLELQVTVWGYKDPSARWGQGAIRRYRIINKGAFQIDSMYISQWSDPDVGNAVDDFAGCDTVLNIGFAYNGQDHDTEFDPFGLAPPAIGYSILQGPIVPGVPGDTALFNFKKIPGFKNLPMTSFGYMVAGSPFGSDPALGDYQGTREWYNLLRGFGTISDDINNPIPFLVGSGSHIGEITKFPLSGDPVSDPTGALGDVDGQGNNPGPADRRMAICSGPFIMMPGDTQEVVMAMFGGIGDTRFESITEMKQNIEFMRSLYGKPILIPQVSHQTNYPTGTTAELFVQANLQDFTNVTGADVSFDPVSGSEPPFTLILFDDGAHNDSLAGDGIWGNSFVLFNRKYPYDGDLTVNTISEQHSFPGIFSKIRLRPLPDFINWRVTWENGQQDLSINYNERVHLTYDIHNLDNLNDISEVEIINLDPSASIPSIQYNNTIPPGGIAINDSLFLELVGPSQGDSMTFFYAISFDGHQLEFLSSSYPLVAWNPNPIWGDTLSVQSIVGVTDNVFPIVADPLLLTGHTYRIIFFQDTTSGDLLWRLIDHTIGSTKLDSLEIATSPNYPHPVVDGIEWQVLSPGNGFSKFLVVANANGPLDPPEMGCFAFNSSGFPTLDGLPPGAVPFNDRPNSARQQTNGSTWGFNAGPGTDYTYAYFVNRTTRDGANWPHIMPYDWEMRFTAGGSDAWMAFTSGSIVSVPFELWNVGIGTYNDPSDDYRLIPLVFDEDGNDLFNLMQIDHSISGGDNDPYTDWIYWYNPADLTPGSAGYDAWVASGHDGNLVVDENMARTVLVNWNGGSVSDPTWPANVDALMPEEGTIFRILTNKANFAGDILEVISPPPLGIAAENIPATFYLHQNYPNPFNPETHIRFGLAQKVKVKLEIFNVLGQRVKTLVDGDMTPGKHEVLWNGRNDAGVQVSSGVYFYRLKAGNYVNSRKMVLIR